LGGGFGLGGEHGGMVAQSCLLTVRYSRARESAHTIP
jgi:hypothetical protein